METMIIIVENSLNFNFDDFIYIGRLPEKFRVDI